MYLRQCRYSLLWRKVVAATIYLTCTFTCTLLLLHIGCSGEVYIVALHHFSCSYVHSACSLLETGAAGRIPGVHALCEANFVTHLYNGWLILPG